MELFNNIKNDFISLLTKENLVKLLILIPLYIFIDIFFGYFTFSSIIFYLISVLILLGFFKEFYNNQLNENKVSFPALNNNLLSFLKNGVKVIIPLIINLLIFSVILLTPLAVLLIVFFFTLKPVTFKLFTSGALYFIVFSYSIFFNYIFPLIFIFDSERIPKVIKIIFSQKKYFILCSLFSFLISSFILIADIILVKIKANNYYSSVVSVTGFIFIMIINSIIFTELYKMTHISKENK